MLPTRPSLHTQLYSWNTAISLEFSQAQASQTRSTIPRPCNPFILFRRQYSQTHAGTSHNTNTGSLSRRAADAWKALSSEEKHPWILLAQIEKEEHRRKYPDYQFRPRKSISKTGKTTSRKNRTLSRAVRECFHLTSEEESQKLWERSSSQTTLGPQTYTQNIGSMTFAPHCQSFGSEHSLPTPSSPLGSDAPSPFTPPSPSQTTFGPVWNLTLDFPLLQAPLSSNFSDWESHFAANWHPLLTLPTFEAETEALWMEVLNIDKYLRSQA